ncbi:unnamed protein product [Allacma fusca]|uniref:RAP domain-containing protein n=1 Tax=Allacma fusca TaxID=39272 RepID=A0A8J2NV20_9HEXA|nr:unnamed protein product [Allacma fusca]
MKRVNHQTFTFITSFLKHRGPSLSTWRYIGNSYTSSPIILTRNCRLFSSSPAYLSKPFVTKEEITDDFSDVTAVEDVESSDNSRNKDGKSRIAKATDTKALLELSIGPNVSVPELCLIVFKLGEMVRKGSSSENILEDARFNRICSRIQKTNFTNGPYFLLQAMHGLVSVGVPSDNTAMSYLQNELKWVVRRCPIRFVARAINILSNLPGDTLKITQVDRANKQLISSHPLSVAISSLERRWLEVTTGSEFISTFQIMSFLNDDVRSNLEDRAGEVMQNFTAMEMVKIFISLGNQKRRPTPLLRALAFHLSKSEDVIEPKDSIELMYALNELSFADPVLVNKICNDLSPAVCTITSNTLISSLLTSLGQMRYKHKDISTALEDWVMKNMATLRPSDYAAWLMTSAVLNIRSEHTEAFCTQAKKVLYENRPKNPVMWLSIVHSLASLKHLDSSLISTVLAPDFTALINGLGVRASGAKLKLLNLNAATKSIENYQGPRLPEDVVKEWSSTIPSSDEKLSKSLFETLQNFLPPPKYLKGSEKHHTGVYVDAFCKLSDKLDPIPVDTVPDDSRKIINVAIVVHGYLTQTSGIKGPTGLSTLQEWLLQNEGYHVLTVPFTEFHPEEKVLRRVQYLEQKMRSINLQSGAESP